MSAGEEIAAEVAAALIEAGEATGSGPLYCTLKIPKADTRTPSEVQADGPLSPAADLHELTGVEGSKEVRDRSGSLEGTVKRVISLNATGTAPEKNGLIAIGVRKDDVISSTKFETIESVKPTAPGGVPVMFEVTLAD